jgi:hypothetical protein
VEGDAWKSIEVIQDLGEPTDIKIVAPDSHEELMEDLNEMIVQIKAGKFMYESILFDSGSYWMNCKLAVRLEDDRNEGRDTGKLKDQTVTTWDEVGAANSQMSRLTDRLKTISKLGVFTVMTAQMMENPKWNRDLEAAPCFLYKDFNKILKGYFDYIGFLQTNLDDDNNPIFPPDISFSSELGYMVKWRGIQPRVLKGPCDFSKIFPKYFEQKGG